MMRRFHVPLLGAALLYGVSAQAGFDEARQAFIEGDYETAHRELVPLAYAGDPRSQIGMGLLHAKGYGVEQDNVTAYVWFDRVLTGDEPLNPVIRTLASTNRAYLARTMPPEDLELARQQAGTPLADDRPPVSDDQPSASAVAHALPQIVLASAGTGDVETVAAADRTDVLAPYNLHAVARPAAAIATPRSTTVDERVAVRIQIGAYRGADEAAVQAAWERIRASQSETLGTLQPTISQVTLGERGEFWRLQAGPFPDRSAARATCAKLKAVRQDCFVVGNS